MTERRLDEGYGRRGMKVTTVPKLIDRLRADARIRSIEHEPCNGWWVGLTPGWSFGGTGEAHCFSERTLADVRRSLKVVALCECRDCKKAVSRKLDKLMGLSSFLNGRG